MARRRRRTKADNLRSHARRLAAERFDLTLTRHDFRIIVQRIQERRCLACFRQSNTRSIHRMTYRNHLMDVVYHHRYKMVVTFMYPFDPFSRKEQ